MPLEYPERRVDPDNDPLYRKPRGWRDAKRALGGEDSVLGELMKCLEKFGAPRCTLEYAIGFYLLLTKEEKSKFYNRFCDAVSALEGRPGGWVAAVKRFGTLPPAPPKCETLSKGECWAFEKEWLAAAEKIAGQ